MASLGKGKNIAELEIEFDKVMCDLGALIQLSPSAERLNIVASTWKRKLALYKKDKDKTIHTLSEAARNYYEAFKLGKKSSGVYSYTNWFTMENLLVIAGVQNWGVRGKSSRSLPPWKKVQETLKAMEKEHGKPVATDNYWTKIEVPNLKLCAWMLEATKDKKTRSMPDSQKLLNSYLAVWKMSGTKNEKDIEVQHLNLIIEALKLIAPGHFSIKAVAGLRDKLKAAI